jgi:hypothetical protein
LLPDLLVLLVELTVLSQNSVDLLLVEHNFIFKGRALLAEGLVEVFMVPDIVVQSLI